MNVSDGCIWCRILIWYSGSRRGRTEDGVKRFAKTVAGQRDLPFRRCEGGLLIFFRWHFEPFEVRCKYHRGRQGKTLVMPGLIVTELEVTGKLFVRMLFHHFGGQLRNIIIKALTFLHWDTAICNAVPVGVEIQPLRRRRAFRRQEKQIAALVALWLGFRDAG